MGEGSSSGMPGGLGQLGHTKVVPGREDQRRRMASDDQDKL
jgi:hypothetical protein